MRISNVNPESIKAAIKAASLLYQDNICASPEGIRPRGSSYLVRLATRSYEKPGWRYSASGRRLPSASWEAHRDFMIALFTLAPNAVIRTALETYRGAEDFSEKYEATADHNCGSHYSPVSITDLTA